MNEIIKKRIPSKKRKKRFLKQTEMGNVVVNLLSQFLSYKKSIEGWSGYKYEAEKAKIYKLLMPILQGLPICEQDQIPDTLNALCGSAVSYKTEKSEYGYAPVFYLMRFFMDYDGEGEIVEKEPNLDYLKRTGLLESLDQVMRTGKLEIKIDLKNHSSDRILWEIDELLRAIKEIKKVLSQNDNFNLYNEAPKITDPQKVYLWLKAWTLWKPKNSRGERLSDIDIIKKLFPKVRNVKKLDSLRKSVSTWYYDIDSIFTFIENIHLENLNPFFLLGGEKQED